MNSERLDVPARTLRRGRAVCRRAAHRLGTVLAALCVVALAGGSAPVHADTLTVCAVQRPGCRYVGGNGIQQAVDTARDGDSVRLLAGTYRPEATRDIAFQGLTIRGFVVLNGKRVDIVGEPGTILDGARGRPSSAFVIERGRVRLRGLEIRGFRAALADDDVYDGHGVFVVDAAVSLDDIVVSRVAKMGLSVRGDSTVDARRLRFLDGHVGVWLEEAARLSLHGAVFENHDSAGIAAYGASAATVANGVFAGCRDDGVYAEEDANVEVLNTLFARNAPFAVHASQRGRIAVRYSLFHANAGAMQGDDRGEVVRGENILGIDPAAGGDYRPLEGSPLIDAGDPALRDADGSRSDIGVFGGDGERTRPHYTVTRRFTGPDGEYDYVSVDAQAQRLYVARGYGVMAIDLASGTVVPKLVAGNDVAAVMPVPGTEFMLATNWGGRTATLFDRRSGAVRAEIATGDGPDTALFDAASGAAYIMNARSRDITVIDLDDVAPVATIPLPGSPEGGATDGEGRVFVNIEDPAAIAVIDTRTRAVITTYTLAGCSEPTGLAFDPRSLRLIAACRNGVARLVDARSGRDRGAIAIGRGADAALLDPRTRRVFIPSADGVLSVIALDPGGEAVAVDSVVTQRGARTIAADPRTGRLFLPVARYREDDAGVRTQLPGTFAVLEIAEQ